MARLRPEERETIIRFDDAGDVAIVSTANTTWKRMMAKLWGPGEKQGDGPWVEWQVPKLRIRLPRPQRKRGPRKPKNNTGNDSGRVK
jgi:hypothetical protein